MDDITLYHGDCIEIFPLIATQSVDAIIADLPFGITACPWDVRIPFEPLWKAYKRIIKPRGAIVLFGSQPFTSMLVMSNLEWFRYEWIWDKVNRYTGALNANHRPLCKHDNILVFYKHLPTYNKQFREGKKFKGIATGGHGAHTQYGQKAERRVVQNLTGKHNPCSIIPIKGDVKTEIGLHPTQKPVALLEYLVKTYTNPGDVVLDNVMGSGTTGEACVNTGRLFIGIEMYPLPTAPVSEDKNPDYFGPAQKRIREAQEKMKQLEMELA